MPRGEPRREKMTVEEARAFVESEGWQLETTGPSMYVNFQAVFTKTVPVGEVPGGLLYLSITERVGDVDTSYSHSRNFDPHVPESMRALLRREKSQSPDVKTRLFNLITSMMGGVKSEYRFAPPEQYPEVNEAYARYLEGVIKEQVRAEVNKVNAAAQIALHAENQKIEQAGQRSR